MSTTETIGQWGHKAMTLVCKHCSLPYIYMGRPGHATGYCKRPDCKSFYLKLQRQRRKNNR